MKRRIVLTVLLVGSLLVLPAQGDAASSRLNKINKELSQLHKQMEEAQKIQEKAARDSKNVTKKKEGDGPFFEGSNGSN